MLLRDRKRLARLMAIQDVSGRTLAKAAGYKSHSYVQRLLRGDARWVDDAAGLRIATFLGVDVTDLFALKTSGDTGQIAKQQKRRVA